MSAAEMSREPPNMPKEKSAFLRLRQWWSNFFRENLDTLFKAVGTIILLGAIGSCNYYLYVCDEISRARVVEQNKKAEEYRISWYKECLAEKKQYECDALWMAAHK